MKKLLTISACILFIILPISFTRAQALPNLVWANGFGGTGDDYGRSIALDVSGNVYATGSFSGTVDFDPGPGTFTLTSNGNQDIFILKLNSIGALVWVKKVGGPGNDEAQNLVVDAAGNVFYIGYFQGTLDFDPGVGTFTMFAGGGNGACISKLDASGNFVWSQAVTGTNSNQGSGVILDGSGNVYATGNFLGTSDFDPGPGTFTLASVGNQDIFMLKLNPSGNFVWAFNIGSTGVDAGNKLSVDAANNIYCTGSFFLSPDFDPGPSTYSLTSAGFQDIFILKVDASGNFIWARRVGDTGIDIGNHLFIDASGNINTTGVFSGTCDFDPGVATYTLSSNGGYDIYNLKLDASGNFVWANSIGGSGNDWGYAVSTDTFGNVYTTGNFAATIDLDPGAGVFTVTPVGSADIYISKLTSAGNFVWGVSMGSSSYDTGYGIALNAMADIFSIGVFYGTCDFDPNAGVQNINCAGSEDFYLQRLTQCAAPTAPTNTTVVSNQTICSGTSGTLSATGSGTINWFATPSSTNTLGSGTVFITPTLSPGTYTYYAEATTCTVSASRTPITLSVSVCVYLKDEQSSESSIILFPNPFTSLIGVLASDAGAKQSLLIYNCLGSLIHTSIIENKKTEIDLSAQPNGIYFIRIGTQTKKLIKE